MDDDDVFSMIAAERTELADLLDGLDETQWNTPSLCAGWRVREVVAHLVTAFSIPMPELMAKMQASNFDFDKVMNECATEESRTNDELAAVLRANAETRFTPPGSGPEAPLSDVVIHRQDICRPLGIVHTVSTAQAGVVLNRLVSPTARRLAKEGVLDDLSFTSTDTGWTHGSGEAVHGSATALIVTIAGRSAALDELSGEGVSLLRSRFAT